jgi:hypothetical protein
MIEEEDDEIAEIHAIRKRISERFNHDLHAYFEYLRELERTEFAGRMASPETIARLRARKAELPSNEGDAA